MSFSKLGINEKLLWYLLWCLVNLCCCGLLHEFEISYYVPILWTIAKKNREAFHVLYVHVSNLLCKNFV